MATGIPAKDKSKADIVPISISYDGKIASEKILHRSYSDFSFIDSINGGEGNLLYYGDNIDVLLYLLNNGYKERIRLIYIDPPFATASNFVNRNQEHAYSDFLCGGEYIEFLRERLIIMHELLTNDGSIYLHLDGNMAFAMKIIMDEIFGEGNCRAFITRKKCSTKNYTKNTYGNISDYIMFYSKSPTYVWNRPFTPWEFNRMIEEYPYIDPKSGRRYKKVPVHAPGIRNGETGKEWRGKLPPKGKHWQYTPKKLDELDKAGEIYWSATGNPRRMVFCEPDRGIPVQDIWLDYRDSINQAQRTTGYPTEKNLDMLKLIIGASSNEGDIVMECFAGSGTTLSAAFELNRRWIGADNSLESMKSILKRFTIGLDVYGDYVANVDSRQCIMDVFPKCSFSIFANAEHSDAINAILKN